MPDTGTWYRYLVRPLARREGSDGETERLACLGRLRRHACGRSISTMAERIHPHLPTEVELRRLPREPFNPPTSSPRRPGLPPHGWAPSPRSARVIGPLSEQRFGNLEFDSSDWHRNIQPRMLRARKASDVKDDFDSSHNNAFRAARLGWRAHLVLGKNKTIGDITAILRGAHLKKVPNGAVDTTSGKEELEAMRKHAQLQRHFYGEKAQDCYEECVREVEKVQEMLLDKYSKALLQDRGLFKHSRRDGNIRGNCGEDYAAGQSIGERETPLRKHIPSWLPREQRDAMRTDASSFDTQHYMLKARAREILEELHPSQKGEDLRLKSTFASSERDVRRHRFVRAHTATDETVGKVQRRNDALLIFEPWTAGGASGKDLSFILARGNSQASEAEWDLRVSMWRQRPFRIPNDSQDFYDTEACARRRFELLFDRALRYNHQSLAQYILSNDGDSGDESEDDVDLLWTATKARSVRVKERSTVDFLRGGIPKEIEEVKEVFWEHEEYVLRCSPWPVCSDTCPLMTSLLADAKSYVCAYPLNAGYCTLAFGIMSVAPLALLVRRAASRH